MQTKKQQKINKKNNLLRSQLVIPLLFSVIIGLILPNLSIFQPQTKISQQEQNMEQKKHYYFAYGSNMNFDRMKTRDCQAINRELGILFDYKLDFSKKSQVKGKSFANVRQQKNSIVQGALYELADFDQILKMDVFENHPNDYNRELLKIKTKNGKFVEAWVYIATQEYIVEDHLPNKEYLSHLMKGEDLLSQDYFLKIKNQPTID